MNEREDWRGLWAWALLVGLVGALLLGLTGCDGSTTICTTYPGGTVACQKFPAPLPGPGQ